MIYPTIRINDRFDFSRTHYEYILEDYGPNNPARLNEKGKPKTAKQTYFGRLDHMVEKIVDYSMEGIDSIDDLIARCGELSNGQA